MKIRRGSTGRTASLLAGVLVIAVAAIALAVGLTGGDGLGGVRDDSAVTRAVKDPSGNVEIDLRGAVETRRVRSILDQVPEDASSVTLRLGVAEVWLRSASSRSNESRIAAFAAVAAAKAPATAIDVRTSGVRAWVARRNEVEPLAIELAQRLADSPEHPARGYLTVGERDTGSTEDAPVSISLDGDPAPLVGALRAAQSLSSREPRVSGNTQSAALRVTADSEADVAKAWAEATRALREAGAPIRDTRVYVDRAGVSDGPARPELSGAADQSADRALRLLTALRSAGSEVYAATDLSFAEVRVPGAAAARGVASAAQAAGIERFAVSWTTLDEDAAWTSGMAGADRTATVLEDRPAVVLTLLAGVARAKQAGIPAVQWDRRLPGNRGRLRLARPDWVADDDGDPAVLRRLARAVRAVEWPGTAAFELILWRGSCVESPPRSAAVVLVTSTSTGTAREVEFAAGGCTDDAVLGRVQRAWDATASTR